MSGSAGKGGSKATQFKKGQSGNLRGRPKKRPEARKSAFDIIIDKKLTIVQNGEPREVTVEEGLQHKIYQDAIAGKRVAQHKLLKMIAKREKAITNSAPPTPSGVEFRIEREDPSNADEALLILGIACRDPRYPEDPSAERERLLLEPWAVKAALGRRRGQRLDKSDIADAKRCTQDADTLRWPTPEES